MILVHDLLGLMAKKGLSQADMAKRIGVTPKTFYTKMKKGVFGSDEIEKMIQILDIKDPARIFFANVVS